MKRIAVLLMLFVSLYTGPVLAQESVSDNDSIECLKNYSLYSLSLKKKMYDYAITPWRMMFDNCPTTTIRLYSDGIKLYDHYVQVAKSEDVKSALIDTIMLIYDRRIQYFGNHPKYSEGWILGRKGMDMLKYRKGDKESLEEVYTCFDRSIRLMGKKSEPVIVLNWMQASNAMFAEGKVSSQEILENYFVADDIIAQNLRVSGEDDNYYETLRKVEQVCMDVLSGTGFSDCSQLENGLKTRYESNKDDVVAVRKVLTIMDKLDCASSSLYVEAAEQNYRLEPDSEAAYFLAKMFFKKNDMDKARDYYVEAISQSDNDEFKARLNYELAVITFGHFKNGPEARAYAFKATQLNPKWGKPYILIGNIYAFESKTYGENDFEHKTVYWAALDKYLIAKRLDPECALEAEKQIDLYSQYMPDKETGFFHGFHEGEKYKVGSWINEETTVRYR